MAPIVNARNLTKRYQVGVHSIDALVDLNIVIEAGEFVAIVGPSGSGKSTCMHILGCLQSPDSGTYEFDGVDVGRMAADRLATLRNERIGFVFQTFHLQPRFTAQRNVELPLVYSNRLRSERGELGKQALERVGLSHRLDHRPNQLSGGEMQRVAIARALVNTPQLLLTDEPTGALDSRTGSEIMDLLGQLNASGMTIVVVTHDPEVAASAHRVIQLRDGRLSSDERAE